MSTVVESDRLARRHDLAALWTFVALVLAAFPLLYLRLGRDQWFRLTDDWDFLTTRDLSDLGDIFKPHFGHLVALPIVVYRGWFALVGFDYRPYLATIIGLHLITIVLLRVVMRRSGVGPWMATVAACTLLLFGSGSDDIVWSFQVTFAGALVFGFAQIILSDHDGPIDRRDWLGLLAGALGLLCSGVGPIMVLAVGLATVIRRGWRAAAFHTIPLGVLYLAWYVPHRAVIWNQTWYFQTRPWGLAGAAAFVWSGLRGTAEAMGGSVAVAVVLGLVLVGGLALAWSKIGWKGFGEHGAVAASLLVGAMVFLVSTSHERTLFGTDYALKSRYLYLTAVFLLPALAIACDAIIRRWRLAWIPVAVVLVLGVPYNIHRFDHPPDPEWVATAARLRDLMAVAPRAPRVDEVPDWVVPDPVLAAGVTIGFLRDQERAGNIPAPVGDTSRLESEMMVRLGVARLDDDQVPPDGATCHEVTDPIDLRPDLGTVIRSKVSLRIATIDDQGRPTGRPVAFSPGKGGQVLEVVLPDLHLRITPEPKDPTYSVCT